MIINYRYYIISLIAIFLSLTIGIVIGFLMDSQQIFTEQQQVIISEIETRFEELKFEKYNLLNTLESYSREKALYDEFTRNIYTDLVKGRLEDINIAIIQTTDEFIFTNVTKPLLDAGANVTSIFYLKKEFFNPKINKLSTFYQELDERLSFGENEDINEKISIEFTKALINGNNRELIEVLRTYKAIEITGELVDKIDYVIVVGGNSVENEEKIKRVDIPIINTIKNFNIPIVGVEHSEVEFSYVKSYKKEQISTVDNIDDIIGQISLVMLLTGHEGNYGIKVDSEALMPPGFKEMGVAD